MKNYQYLSIIMITIACFIGCQRVQTRPLTFNFPGDIAALHPFRGVDLHCRTVQKLLFEGLVRLDQNDRPQLAAAQEYHISEDYKHYVFKLRELYFSDHTRITAHDFVRSWKQALEPDSTCMRADLFYCIKNAEQAKQGVVSMDQVGVSAVDDETLSVALERPTPYFLQLLANSLFAALPDVNQEVTQFSGPFVVDQWVHNHRLTLKKNPMYWDLGKVSLETIDFTAVQDPHTALLMYERSDLDWIGAPFTMLTIEDSMGLQAQHKEVLSQDILGVFWLCLNVKTYPLNHLKIRQALRYALDREMIADHVLDHQKPTSGVFTQLEVIDPQNISKAQKLFQEGLEELGITLAEFPPLELSYANVPGQKQIIEALASMWKEVLGIEIKYHQVDWNVFLQGLMHHQWQVGGCIWFSVYDDPEYFLNFFLQEDNAYNSSSWTNTEYVTILSKAHHTTDIQERLQLLTQAEQLLLEHTPIIPIFSVRFYYLKDPLLEGVVMSKLGHVDLKLARLKSKK